MFHTEIIKECKLRVVICVIQNKMNGFHIYYQRKISFKLIKFMFTFVLVIINRFLTFNAK
jgi:hypothetical protein